MLTKRTWNESSEIKKEHKNLKVLQIYCWIKSLDNKVILVTKDNKKWQFPGGHPEFGEDYKSTLQREILEETGLDISNYLDKLDFFGYYHIVENNEEYLQLRYILNLPLKSQELKLAPKEKVDEKDKIIIAKFVSIDILEKYIPWIKNNEEFKSFILFGLFQIGIKEDIKNIVGFINNDINPQLKKVLNEEEIEFLCPEETEESILEYFNKKEKILLKYIVNGEIGYLIIYREKDEFCVYLSHFYINPKIQNNGLGSLLLNNLEFYLKNQGYKYLLLETQKKFYWAVNFYIKNNYKTITNQTLKKTYFKRFYTNLVEPSILFYKKL